MNFSHFNFSVNIFFEFLLCIKSYISIMAAPLRRPTIFSKVINLHHSVSKSQEFGQKLCVLKKTINTNYSCHYGTRSFTAGRRHWKAGVCAAIGSSVFATGLAVKSVKASTSERPVSRQVNRLMESIYLKIIIDISHCHSHDKSDLIVAFSLVQQIKLVVSTRHLMI